MQCLLRLYANILVEYKVVNIYNYKLNIVFLCISLLSFIVKKTYVIYVIRLIKHFIIIIVVFSSPHHRRKYNLNNICLTLSNTVITSVESVRNLGAFFDFSMNMSKHVSQVCSKANFQPALANR